MVIAQVKQKYVVIKEAAAEAVLLVQCVCLKVHVTPQVDKVSMCVLVVFVASNCLNLLSVVSAKD